MPKATQRHTGTRLPSQIDGAKPAATTTFTPTASRTLTSASPWVTTTRAIKTIAAMIAVMVRPVAQGVGGAIMFVYTCLLLVTNRRYLPEAIRLRGYRIGILLFSVGMLGVTTAIVAVDQIGNLF